MSLPSGDRAPSRAGTHFTLMVAAIGWGALAGSLLWSTGSAPAAGAPWLFALFVAVIVAARTMAFRPVPESVLSLDSGFYVAAAICLGAVPAGRLVALALTIDALIRLAGRRRAGKLDGRWKAEIAYVLYFGGMTGALVMASAALLGADAVDLARDGQLAVAGRVLAIGALLMVAHYAIQGIRSALSGRAIRSYLRQMALPGIVSEASLLPAAVVLVLLYRPDERLAFALVCATYLLVNFVFGRLSTASSALRARVRELEILDTTARRLAASLQLQELVETVAREAVRAIPEAEVVALAHRGPGDGASDRLVVDAYDRDRDQFTRIRVARDDGATGWVIRNEATLRIADLADSDVEAGPAGASGVRSLLGVPILLYGGCDGVLFVQSRAPGAFGPEQQRLLESIGLQVAAALQNAHLYEMAMIDGLTGLFVRRYFDARIEEEVERARRYGTDFSVVMMDVDDFKALNDTHGHQAGDRVLRAVAAVVRANMRGVDTAARYGGEEIALILPRTGMVAAYNQAERIRPAIPAQRVVGGELDGEVVAVTASFGIAAYPESGAQTADDLVRRADRALYRAKQTGKNRVELYWDDDSGKIPAFDAAPVEPDARSAAS
jgi:diguanylate cyclase (GGDEF)-like protein